MPALCNRRGTKRWKGIVKIDGKQAASKWFGPGEKGGPEYKKAIKWEVKERERLATEQVPQTPMVSLTVMEWANAYLDEVKRKRAKGTYTEVRTAFSKLVQQLGADFTVEQISPRVALKHLNEQHDQRSGNAANKDRKNLMRGWKWARRYQADFPQEIVNPFESVERFSENREPRYIPPEEDFWKAYRLTSGQDRVIMTALLHLAARKGELWRLKWTDVDFPNNQVRLATRKTRGGSWEYSWLPMTPTLREALKWWSNERPLKDVENVFVCLEKTPFCEPYYGKPFQTRIQYMRKLCERAKVKRFGFHAIRHLSARMLYEAGETVMNIQAILRHASPNTTERYLKRLGLDPNKLKGAVQVFENRQPEIASFFQAKTEKAPEVAPSEASGLSIRVVHPECSLVH